MIHMAALRIQPRRSYYNFYDLKYYRLGWPPLLAAQAAVMLGRELDEFTKAYFSQSITSDLVIENQPNSAPFTQDQIEMIYNSIERRTRGTAKMRTPLMLPANAKITSLKTDPNDGQLLQLRVFQIEDIARAFGVPKEFMNTGNTSGWGTAIEQIARNLHRFTMKPWMVQVESSLTHKLLNPVLHNYFEIRFDTSELLRGDDKTLAFVLSKLLGGPGAQGAISVNEARIMLGLKPLDDPDMNHPMKSGKPESPRRPHNAAQ